MFERFTKEARFAVVQAQDECRGLSAKRMGTEHLLLGLLDGDGPAGRVLREHGLEITALREAVRRGAGGDPLDADALRSLGIDLDAVRRAAEETFGEGALDAPPGAHRKRGYLHPDPAAKKSLELALRHAVRLKNNHISDGHLLLGLIHDENATAVTLLRAHGVDIDALRADITKAITTKAA
ncbi:Clp protease N-terminal domain-containing protein [Actinomadura sp. SCN-SB]|uniref:Clp protease N-terminal domain-containing protein n=1 Tax=Actinomadura sp. SCN-SB TaxID=3373092 RepID=UPI00374FFA7A